MRFLSIDSRLTFHASFPRAVTLAQLHFPSLAVVSSREDFHLQDRAHAGRTNAVDPAGVDHRAAGPGGAQPPLACVVLARTDPAAPFAN